MLVVQHVVFDADVDHLRSSEEEGLIQILRETLIGGKIRVGNDETVLVVRCVVFVFDANVDHLRLPEEEGLIQILRETLPISYNRWIHKVGESFRTSDSNGALQ